MLPDLVLLQMLCSKLGSGTILSFFQNRMLFLYHVVCTTAFGGFFFRAPLP